MLSTPLKRKAPAALLSFAELQLKAVLNDVPHVEAILLCSTDGFELASIHQSRIANTGKLAAVSSSILAMVQAFMGEIQLHGCQNITLNAENGQAVLSAVPHAQYPLVLVTIANKDVLLGQLLYAIKKAVENIRSFTE